jgi:ABC-type transporter Mla subunit MlaD
VLADAGAAQADALADRAGQQLDAAQASAQDVAESAQNQAQDVSDTLGDAGQAAQQQAQALAEEGMAKLRVAAQKLSDSMDQTARATGGTLRGAASGVRAYAPESGAAADISERLASGLEQSGAYLERQGDGTLVDRMAEWVRRHPLAVTLAGGGIVLLLARRRRG